MASMHARIAQLEAELDAERKVHALTQLARDSAIEERDELRKSVWCFDLDDYEPREGDWVLADFPHQGVTRFAVAHDFEYRRATILPHVTAFYRPPAPPEVL